MHVDLLDTFLDVLDSRNFNRTAERLEITQSSVSARIRSLENHVGAQLFERGRSGATPTAAGLRFEQHARLLRASWDHAKRDVGGGRESDNILRLAGQYSLMRSTLIKWVIALRTKDPRLALDVQADYSTQIIQNLSLGITDIGVLYAPQYLPDLDIRQEGLERFTMVSSATGSLAAVRPEDYIHTGYTSYFDRCQEQLLPQFSSSSISVGHEELSVFLIKQLGGATYLPESLANELVGSDDALQIVTDAPLIEQPVYSAVHVRRRHDHSVLQALAILSEHFR